MTAARNLQLYPGNKSARRERGTYSLMDTPVVAYLKTHGAADTRILMALAEAANYRRGLKPAELMLATGLCESAVRKALPRLRTLHLVQLVADLWWYIHPNRAVTPLSAEHADAAPDDHPDPRADDGADGRPDDGTCRAPKNTVLYAKMPTLKEVEGSLRNKNNNIFTAYMQWGAKWARQAVAEKKSSAVKTTPEPETTPATQVPVGTGPTGPALPPHPRLSFASVARREANQTATGVHNVPPAPGPDAALPSYRECQDALTEARLWDVWVRWIKANPGMSHETQNAQIAQMVAWTRAGHGPTLRREVGEVVELGSYDHPWAGLRGRMETAVKAAQTPVPPVQAEPMTQSGERRQAPDGRVWTVESHVAGRTYFAELDAPRDVLDAHVSCWPLVGA